MKILGIDTSTKNMSMAIIDGETILGEINFYANMDHSEKIMDNLSFLLKSTGIKIADLDAFAVAVGPGSFTGIRIGISTIKGLAEFNNISVVPISSLKILAANIKRETVAVLIDAKRDRVYGYIVDQSSGTIILPEDLYNIDEIIPYIKEDMVVLTDLNDINVKIGEYRELINSGAELCRLALENIDKKISHLELKANYMTKSQAELQRERNKRC